MGVEDVDVMNDDVEPDEDGDGESEYGRMVVDSPRSHPEPGDVVVTSVSPGTGVVPEPLVGRRLSSPLEDDEPEGVIPPSPLLAMKMRRHGQMHIFHSHDDDTRVRDVLGDGDETLYVIDDGRNHVMLGRRVGSTETGAEYSLIGRAQLEWYFSLKGGDVELREAFSQARDLRVCCTVSLEDVLTANVFDVENFASAAEIPEDYLPGHPYMSFADDLEVTAD
ncbi:MAG: hypothetical protein M1134_02545 [Actinobacteria bacterium]|nr:hypothetical protein [Actinomycetota bacterium]MCL5444566.1 hypothetical protein [Actinomycetota bacterium]